MKITRQALYQELRELIPVTIFFLVTFQLLAFTDALLLRQYGITVSVFMNASIMALIVAKVVLIADHFRFVNLFSTRPLICNILWKTFVYTIAIMVMRYLEHLISLWQEIGDVSDANHKLLSEVIWPHFLAVQIWLIVLVFAFCLTREFVRAVGREQTLQLLFRMPVRDKR